VGFGSPLFYVAKMNDSGRENRPHNSGTLLRTEVTMTRLSSIFAALLLSVIPQGRAQVHGGPSSGADLAVRAVLQSQVEAWNRHDLDLFMNGYWHSSDLTFFSGTTETKGWEPTLERYRTRYQSEGHAMGTLSFNDLQVESLSPDSAFVRGKFRLTMPDGKQPQGVFTLVFRRFPEGWRIIHNHTCAE
jgi:ketosteroid isomerase-like protein